MNLQKLIRIRIRHRLLYNAAQVLELIKKAEKPNILSKPSLRVNRMYCISLLRTYNQLQKTIIDLQQNLRLFLHSLSKMEKNQSKLLLHQRLLHYQRLSKSLKSKRHLDMLHSLTTTKSSEYSLPSCQRYHLVFLLSISIILNLSLLLKNYQNLRQI